MKPGATRMCTLPFTTPSVEPNGDVRLCSAASTYAYLHETNMGNCREAGLGAVWRNERFQRIRQSLLTGENLTPYCETCEYRAEGPPWMLQLHLALHAFNQNPAPELLPIIAHHADRYDVYRAKAAEVGLGVEPLPEELRIPGCWRWAMTVPEGDGRLTFARDDQWAETSYGIAPIDLASLAAGAHASVACEYRVEGTPAPASIRLRISLESARGDALYVEPSLPAHEGTVRSPLTAFRTDATIPLERWATRIRVGGTGPVGATVSLRSIEIAMPGGNPVGTALNPYRTEATRQAADAAALREDVAALQSRLDALERWVAPLRRLLVSVPGPLRRAGKRLLGA
jgi:radical SAM protein with 4Fe4S-binding SPASM domain